MADTPTSPDLNTLDGEEYTQTATTTLPAAPRAKRANDIKKEKETDTVSLHAGTVLGESRYKILGRIGVGGSADIYSATHLDLDRKVAIKVLSAHFAQKVAFCTQFRLEARSCAKIDHPNVVKVFDCAELKDGRPYYTMELIDGLSLAEYIKTKRSLSVSEALLIARQVAKGLAEAHAIGVVHRDLKPENIMLLSKNLPKEEPPLVKVVDFGIMAFQNEIYTEKSGTPGYIAPEHVNGAVPSSTTDIYGLGTIIYEMIAGKLPYPQSSYATYVAAQKEGAPQRIDTVVKSKSIPKSLVDLIAQCLETNPTKRVQTMLELERALHKVHLSETVLKDSVALISPPLLSTKTAEIATDRKVRINALGLQKHRKTALWIAAGGALSLFLLLVGLRTSDKTQLSPVHIAPEESLKNIAIPPKQPLRISSQDKAQNTPQVENTDQQLSLTKNVPTRQIDMEYASTGHKKSAGPHYLKKADKALRQGHILDASKLYKQSLKTRGSSRSRAHMGLAKISFTVSNQDRCVFHGKRVLSDKRATRSRKFQAALLVGDCYFAKHDAQNAKTYWIRAKRYRKKSTAVSKRLAHINLH